MSLQILELCLSDAYGGLEMSAARIARGLADRGLSVVLCCPSRSRLAQTTGIPVKCIAKRLPYVDPLACLRLLGLVRQFGPDIIHVHQSQDLPLAAYIKRRHPNIKVVYTQHMESARVKKDFFHRWVYGNIDLILGVTWRICEILPNTIPLPPERIHHLYLGVELPNLERKAGHRTALRARHGLREDDFVILFPGRLDPQKGQHLMIEALGRLKAKNMNPHVIFAGAPTGDVDGYDAALRKKCLESGVEQQVLFAGHVQNMDPYYSAVDISVLATKHETFGLVLLEAMAWKTPVIASRAGGPLEIITEGADGWFFSPMDAGDLARAVEHCMRNRDTLAERGEVARYTVEQRFQFAMTIDKLVEIFNGICAKSAKAGDG